MIANEYFPLVSVIITTYCNERYLPRAIDSVLNQNYPQIELIVVDDNHPNSEARRKTELIMKHYPDVVYLQHSENKNGSAARNTGIRASHGAYIAFLDNDDIYFHSHISDCVHALTAHPECKCALCHVVKISQGSCWDLVKVPASVNDFAKSLLLCETALGTGSNLFVEANAVRELGGFNEQFLRHQDVEFALRLFTRSPMYGIDKVQIIKEMDGHSNAPDYERFLATKQQFQKYFSSEINALSSKEQLQFYAGQYSALLYTACRSGIKSDIFRATSDLAQYRRPNPKECLMIFLGTIRLFFLYEFLKKNLRKRQSAQIYREMLTNLSKQDLQLFYTALEMEKKE